ncbi:MAG: DNA cytosine methyltransferase, partial [Proteobacteria bacterium]
LEERTETAEQREDRLEDERIERRRQNLFQQPPMGTVRAELLAKQTGTMPIEQARHQIAEWKAIARAQTGNTDKTVLSLFDFTGEWSKPWEEAGYNVVRLDIKNGQDINDIAGVEYLTQETDLDTVDVILAACPCTDFAASGARWWRQKDETGETEGSIELVKQTLRLVEYFQPDTWAIENPIGRIKTMVGLPEPRLTFNPHHYGDPYTKKTQLYGNFDENLPQANVKPTEGSKMHKMSTDIVIHLHREE